MGQSLIFRLRERARIRRSIPNRKSVQEGAPDRIADLLDEAADALDWHPIETAPKNVCILVYIPDDQRLTGPVQAAIHAKISNGYSWFIGHRFGFDCGKPTKWKHITLPETEGDTN